MELWKQPVDYPFCMKVPPIMLGDVGGGFEVMSVSDGRVILRGNEGTMAMPLNQWLNWRESGFRRD